MLLFFSFKIITIASIPLSQPFKVNQHPKTFAAVGTCDHKVVCVTHSELTVHRWAVLHFTGVCFLCTHFLHNSELHKVGWTNNPLANTQGHVVTI